jgi:hypothetical protein
MFFSQSPLINLIIIATISYTTIVNHACVNNGVQQSQTACENSMISIQCCDGIINILSAMYGREDYTTCPFGINRNCKTANALNVASSNCLNKTSCSITASNQFFNDDPCPSSRKYTTVNFICVMIQTTIISTTTTTTTKSTTSITESNTKFLTSNLIYSAETTATKSVITETKDENLTTIKLATVSLSTLETQDSNATPLSTIVTVDSNLTKVELAAASLSTIVTQDSNSISNEQKIDLLLTTVNSSLTTKELATVSLSTLETQYSNATPLSTIVTVDSNLTITIIKENIFTQTINKSEILSIWSNWSPWSNCVFIKSRKHLDDPTQVEKLIVDVACSSICKLNFFYCVAIIIYKQNFIIKTF